MTQKNKIYQTYITQYLTVRPANSFKDVLSNFWPLGGRKLHITANMQTSNTYFNLIYNITQGVNWSPAVDNSKVCFSPASDFTC